MSERIKKATNNSIPFMGVPLPNRYRQHMSFVVWVPKEYDLHMQIHQWKVGLWTKENTEDTFFDALDLDGIVRHLNRGCAGFVTYRESQTGKLVRKKDIWEPCVGQLESTP